MAISTELGGGEANPESVGRYRVLERLGHGGMAVVYRVVDPAGEELALKLLRATASAPHHAASIERLFEHEYHTLSQLQHPRIVRVGDFGREAGEAFYTMELLTGGDLRELSPLPWQRACALIADVCSAVSLLHSRRLVHRDLSTRNIRCTEDGKAKLIDFGAMVPMGKSRQLVGTPAFCAPEMVDGQSVDARTDLFALGASLYHALTGRHAYPARRFDELRSIWTQSPVAPSRIVSDIPDALNALVLAMLHLDPMARPANAAEVMERLQVIGNLDPAEHQLVPQSYLSTPTLVGRTSLVDTMRGELGRAMTGRGRTLLVEGEAGMGRSRCLDACALEGKLAGATVIRLRGDGESADWTVTRDLIGQLTEAMAGAVLDNGLLPVAVLEHLTPGTAGRLGIAAAAEALPVDAREAHAAIQAGLREWLLKLTRRHALVVTVDDWERVDAASAALLATLSHKAPRRRLLLIATLLPGDDQARGPAFKVLSERAQRIQLEPLTELASLKMLQSMFGDPRHLGVVAHHLYAASKGYPRNLVRLAQHLVDTGEARYEAGSWQLPAKLDPDSLPASPTKALALRAERLNSEALYAARLLAVYARPVVTFDECVALIAPDSPSDVARAMDGLVAVEMLDGEQDRYRWSEQSWKAVLLEHCPPDVQRDLHLRIADHLQGQPMGAMRAAHHRMLAGEPELALEGLLALLGLDGRMPHDSGDDLKAVYASVPEGWPAQVKHLIRMAEQQGRPQLDAFKLRSHILLLSAVMQIECREDFFVVTDQLVEASGLGAYHALPEDVPEGEKLGKAFASAQARYDALPEEERILAPAAAIRQLALVIAQAIGSAGHANDVAFFEALPSLAPFVPLSPAIEILDQNLRATAAMSQGRGDLARDGYVRILERLKQPDRGGLEGSYYDHVRLAVTHALAIILLHYGRGEESVELGKELEANPVFRVHAFRTRMLHALNLGDVARAEQWKRRIELVQLQGTPAQFFEGGHLWTEAQSYSLSDDLTHLKGLLPDLVRMADLYPGWRPVLHYAEANYHRIRGDHERALASCDEMLRLALPGKNLAWRGAQALHVQVLSQSGQHEAATAQGRAYLEQMNAMGLPVLVQVPLRDALAMAELRAGHLTEAMALATEVLAALQEVGSRGLLLGSAHEIRARIAIAMADTASFTEHAQRCAEVYRSGRNPALTAKYETLIAEADEAGLDITTGIARAAILSEITRARRTSTGTGMRSLVTMTGSLTERAEQALDLLVEHTGAAGGLLYLLEETRPQHCASLGAQDVDLEGLDSYVAEFLGRQLDEMDEVTATGGTDQSTSLAPAWTGPDGVRHLAYALSHRRGGEVVIMGAVLLRQTQPGRSVGLPELLGRISLSLDPVPQGQQGGQTTLAK